MRRSTDRNVLLVIVDDLRQQLAHTSPLEGEDTSFMVTPVLDGLAREAVSFRRAHVQIAVCAPSRSSVFFGRRPDTVGVFSLQSSPRTGMCADCITLPDLFRARGWRPCPGDLADALGSIARKCMAEDVAGRPGFDEVSNALLCC